jgi:hypothetical protein
MILLTVTIIIVSSSFIFLVWALPDNNVGLALILAVLVPVPIIFTIWCFYMGLHNKKGGDPNQTIDSLLETKKKVNSDDEEVE